MGDTMTDLQNALKRRDEMIDLSHVVSEDSPSSVSWGHKRKATVKVDEMIEVVRLDD